VKKICIHNCARNIKVLDSPLYLAPNFKRFKRFFCAQNIFGPLKHPAIPVSKYKEKLSIATPKYIFCSYDFTKYNTTAKHLDLAIPEC